MNEKKYLELANNEDGNHAALAGLHVHGRYDMLHDLERERLRRQG